VSGFQPPVFIPETAIAERVDALARRISADHAGVDDLLMIGVLRGAFMFLGDLARRLTIPCSVDFISLSQHERGATQSEGVRLVMDLRVEIKGRHVLLVEDIVDSGDTLAFLVHTLEVRRPASLRTCVLARKRGPEGRLARLDYVGFDIPDRKFRTLPYIGVVHGPDDA
jgi:hypoxanthine phosphoribosyltransferase